VTLADECQPEKLALAVQSFQQVTLPINIHANRIALVESEPIDIVVEYPI